MIKARSENRQTVVNISGDSETILNELHIIILQILKAFHTQDAEVLVLKMMVDAADEFAALITNKNSNSKGEEKNEKIFFITVLLLVSIQK